MLVLTKMADPDSENVVVFFSVLENLHAHDDDYFPEIISMADEMFRLPTD